jgi:hypothetical protein
MSTSSDERLGNLSNYQVAPHTSDQQTLPAFVINLDRRPDRLKQFNTTCQRMHFGPVTRIAAVDANPPIDWRIDRGNYGCIMSHRAIWEAITQNTVVFEDDASLVRPFFLPPLPPNFDLLYLGGNDSHYSAKPGELYKTYNLGGHAVHVRKCKRLFTTHAYVISPKGAAAALATPMQHVPIDVALCELQSKGDCYYLRPSLFVQAAGHSDITNGVVDHSGIT